MPTATRKACLAVLALFLLCTACFNVFYRLGDGMIASWDEARHGVSALEMIKRGNYLVNTYEFEPDYYNAKPPLAFYHAVAGFKLFGKTQFGLRFFSAVAFLLTALTVGLSALRYRGPAFSLLAVGIFITSIRLLTRHGARTGDADAVFVMLYALSLFCVTTPGRGLHRFLIAAFFAGLAFLCKSFHAAHLGVSLTLLCLVECGFGARFFGEDGGVTSPSPNSAGALRTDREETSFSPNPAEALRTDRGESAFSPNPAGALRTKAPGIILGAACLAAAALPVGLWAYLRMGYDGTTFFEHMLFNDVVQRLSSVIEGHNGGVYYYFIKILQNFPVWLGGLALLTGVFLWSSRPFAARDLPGMFRVRGAVSRRLLLVTAVPVVMLTCSTSKLDWYLYPVFPFLSILLAEAGICFAGRVLRLRPALRPLVMLLPVLCFTAQEVVVLRNAVRLADERDRSQEIIRETAARDLETPVYLFVEAKKGVPRQSLVMASKLYAREMRLLPGGKQAYDAFSGGEKILIYDGVPPPPPAPGM
jgi:4-amino-4-deoxy-L-arabinose transferase-like glycosyltransferase